MDPQQTAVYTKAHGELRDLFREIARHGRVTFLELRHALLPFTAGDAKRDLQELVDDMKRRQTSLDEPDFIRLMWKKMYLSNVIFTTKQTGTKPRPSSANKVEVSQYPTSSTDGEGCPAINIPLAHVIVSIKRRAQLKQFANYYTSRGISGADHLNVDQGPSAYEKNTPRHLVLSQRKRQAAATAAAQAATISALRDQKSPVYDIIVSCYDADMLCMRTHSLQSRVEAASVTNCSRLYCLVSTKAGGSVIVGSKCFIDRVRKKAAQMKVNGSNQDNATDDRGNEFLNRASAKPPLSTLEDLSVERLEDLGLRNIVAFGVGRGIIAAATERRVHCWNALAAPAVAPAGSTVGAPSQAAASEQGLLKSMIPSDVVDLLEDEGDCFGHVPLLKRSKMVSDIANIRQIACGDRFVIGLDASSELVGWGTARLGRGKVSPARLPFFVADPTFVTRVACGLGHVLSLTDHGRVFAWGANVHGQLGVSPQGSVLDGFVDDPVEVKMPSSILDVACGDRHSVVLTSKGYIFAWGNNWEGQLGFDPASTDSGSIFVPTRVPWWVNVDGNPDRSTHQGDDQLDADSGADVRSASSPSKGSSPPLPRAYLVSAIGDTTAIVSDDGAVYIWGKCVPPGRFSGAVGIVSKWRAQRMELELEDGHDVDSKRAVSTVTSPWAGIAIANGLILLTRHRT